jgi:hypothetical protein
MSWPIRCTRIAATTRPGSPAPGDAGPRLGLAEHQPPVDVGQRAPDEQRLAVQVDLAPGPAPPRGAVRTRSASRTAGPTGSGPACSGTSTSAGTAGSCSPCSARCRAWPPRRAAGRPQRCSPESVPVGSATSRPPGTWPPPDRRRSGTTGSSGASSMNDTSGGSRPAERDTRTRPDAGRNLESSVSVRAPRPLESRVIKADQVGRSTPNRHDQAIRTPPTRRIPTGTVP